MLDNISLNTSVISNVELADQPFAVGQYRPVFQNKINQTQQLQLSLEGNTIITLPNSTETIRTTDKGQATITFLPERGSFAHGQLDLDSMDGSESMIVDFTHYYQIDTSTAIGIAYFSTNSTGALAPLNNTIAVYPHEGQPDDSVIVTLEKLAS